MLEYSFRTSPSPLSFFVQTLIKTILHVIDLRVLVEMSDLNYSRYVNYISNNVYVCLFSTAT